MRTLKSADFAASAREKMFGMAGEQSDLQPFLRIQPPASSDDIPPILSFRRKRRVDLPWNQILGDSATAGVTSIAAIREYFEHSWGLGRIDSGNYMQVISGDSARIKALESAAEDVDGNPAPKQMYRANLADEAIPEEGTQPAATVAAGLIIQHAISGRWYLIVARSSEPLSIADLASPTAYQALWDDKVDGVELVFESEQAAAQGVTRFNEVDLRPRVIHRAFNELLIHRDFAENVSRSAATATSNAVEQITSTSLDVDELQRLQEKSFQLQIQTYEANRRLERLVSQAADLGYYLFLQSKKFQFPGGAETPVEPGEIYTQFRRSATWVTTHSRDVTKTTGWWIFKGSKTVRQAYTQRNSKVVTDYRKIDTAADPLVDAVANYRAQNNAVFVFEQDPSGFVTSDGAPLREVMEQCDRNESFRQSCVVMLPVYEESLTGERVLSKYSVFERPLPGISPSALPQFSLLESLSYRSAWVESQLGELVSTINLAPGEERAVVLTKVFEQASQVTRSSTSIFDISRSDSSDLATEMENQARLESERSSSMSFSASAKGSYGLFSAEATASGGSSTSLKSFSQAISKVAKKASQSINQNNREEVSTSSSVKTTVSNKDETSATIRNINEGRTLNLLFYRLNNRFQGGIYLDDLQFEVIPGTEIIAGSGVYESLRFTLDELPDLLQQFQQTRLPFDIVPDDKGRNSFLDKVVASLKRLLEREYLDGGEQRMTSGSREAGPFSRQRIESASSVARVNLLPALAKVARGSSGLDNGVGTADGIDEELVDFIARLRYATIDSDRPILKDDLILASGGLYLDTLVGALASTEPFSEEMRAQEVRMRDAKVQKRLAEAEYQLALAASLGPQAGRAAGDNQVAGDNQIVNLSTDPTQTTVRLRLSDPLAAGQWDLVLDDVRKAVIKSDMAGKKELAHSWVRPQGWLKEKDLIRRVALVERRSGKRVEFSS